MVVPENCIVGMGNPLLDIQAKVSEDFLKKWDLKQNDAILCDEKRIPMFKNMVDTYGKDVEYVAGGSTQNSMRVLQWMLQQDEPAATFLGCIGKDEDGEILAKKAKEAGIKAVYQIKDGVKTGTCAVCIVGHHRSLCANLSAAEKFTPDHVETNWSLIEKAEFYYIAGFFLTVCPPAIMQVALHAAAKNKCFCMNLSAPFLVKFFKQPMLAALPYVDVLFGNDEEMKTFAEENTLKADTIEGIAAEISNMNKVNQNRPRLVIITQGTKSVIIAHGSETMSFPVPLVPDAEIEDTNGAGDAFVGGFLAQYVRGEPVKRCVDAATWAAQQIIRRSGCTLPAECTYQ